MEKECMRSESVGSHHIDIRGIWHLSSEIMEQRFEADGLAKNGTQITSDSPCQRKVYFFFVYLN